MLLSLCLEKTYLLAYTVPVVLLTINLNNPGIHISWKPTTCNVRDLTGDSVDKDFRILHKVYVVDGRITFSISTL